MTCRARRIRGGAALGPAPLIPLFRGVWDGPCGFSNDCYRSDYLPLRGVSRGFSFCDAGPLWEQAVTQGDVWEGVDADALEEEEWRAMADERAWREAREAMRRDANVA